MELELNTGKSLKLGKKLKRLLVKLMPLTDSLLKHKFMLVVEEKELYQVDLKGESKFAKLLKKSENMPNK
jgi:hypothetical protein